MDDINIQLKQVKAASYRLIELDDEKRNQVLLALSQALKDSCDRLLIENAKDLALMPSEDPRYDRLLLTHDRILAIANDVANIARLVSPIGKQLEERIRPNGLRLQKISVSLGVVGVIYESRPNVTIDVFSLCFKAGNACVLKGGKEAHDSNTALVNIIKNVLKAHHVAIESVYLMPNNREATQTLLHATGIVDVCIPRGSQALIDFVREHAKIPVIETGAGIVHTYFDASGDINQGRLIIENAKTRRVSVCNALDTLVIHQSRLDDLWELVKPLMAKNVELFADEASYEKLKGLYTTTLLHQATTADFGREFLAYKMSIKTVNTIANAVRHIMHYTSGHSEAIISQDQVSIDYFLKNVDAAAVYVNASTAFTDGGVFGMGAEIGISTQKLHARGPMALEALTSYKWLIFGNGQIR